MSSGTNFLFSFLAARLLVPEVFGTFVIAFSVVVVLTGIQRALIGEPLLSEVATHEGRRRRALVEDGITAALVLGLIGAALCVGAGLLLDRLFGDLVWLGPWLPVVLLQDAARHVHLSARRTDSALLLDVTWAVVQVAVVGFLLARDAVTVGTLSASWGAGALVSSVLYLATARMVPWTGRPWLWLVRSRHIGVWRMLTVVVGQMQQQGLFILAGIAMSATVVGALRGIQLVVAQPVQTLVTALLALLVPWAARLRAAGSFDTLARRTDRLGWQFAAFGALAFLLIPLGQPFLAAVLPAYVDYDHFVPPLATVAFFTCANAPHQATMRGLQLTRSLFVMQLIALAVATSGVILGAVTRRPEVMAWGLAAGMGTIFVGNLVRCRRALRRGARGEHVAERVGAAPAGSSSRARRNEASTSGRELTEEETRSAWE